MFATLEELFKIQPYSLSKTEKHHALTNILKDLSIYHYEKCESYRKLVKCLGITLSDIDSYYDLPMLPVRLFKEYDLYSIDKEKIFKTMTSSGTSGQQVSKIYLDKETAANQTKTLVQIT